MIPQPARLSKAIAPGGFTGPALSRASVIYALAETEPGAVSTSCEDEVVVSSEAAPSVRAGRSSLTSSGQPSAGGQWEWQAVNALLIVPRLAIPETEPFSAAWIS